MQVLPRSPLAIVICTHNRSRSLLETLSSLYASDTAEAESADLLVVANNCTDDTLDCLSQFRSAHPQERLRLDWIEEPKQGKSHALNAAIARSEHEVVCFIDDDQVVEADFVTSLSAGLRDHPADDIYCGRIWPAWDGSEPAWVHAQPPFAIPIRPFPEFDLGLNSRRIGPDQRLPSGGNISVRRRVFERIGGFAVELGPTGHNLAGGEDHDFLQRAIGAGFRIRFLPRVRQLHAIDPERTRTGYVLKKSYLRSRASFLIDPPVRSPRPYMLRKILGHSLRATFTLNADKRFYSLVRLAASLGELTASVDLARSARSGESVGASRGA